MARSILSKLSKAAQRELLADLNYLNLAEIKSFCKRHSIPYRISIHDAQGNRKITRDDDRKGVILDRIRHFLKTGEILQETCFKAEVVCFDPLPRKLTPNDRLFYGQYDKTNRTMTDLLESLTAGQFKNGAIARIVARKLWGAGKAPTYRQFAAAWLQAVKDHTKPNPEWAFLSDRASKKDTVDWKHLRNEKASRTLKVLGQLLP